MVIRQQENLPEQMLSFLKTFANLNAKSF